MKRAKYFTVKAKSAEIFTLRETKFVLNFYNKN